MARRKTNQTVEEIVVGVVDTPVQDTPDIANTSTISVDKQYIYHKVQRGDTLLSIANRYHRNPQDLLYLKGQLSLGKVLTIK